MKKTKAFTVQSVIISSLIVSIMAITAIGFYYPSVDKAKESLVLSKLYEQYNFIQLEKNSGFKTILELSKTGDNDNDILDELSNAGVLSPISSISFFENNSLNWVIEKKITGDTIELQIKISSSNFEDSKIIDKSISGNEFLLNKVTN